MSRRLPIYVLLDTSASMRGDAIESVRHALRALLSDLQMDPYAIEVAWLSVIVFADTARQLAPLAELASFNLLDIDWECTGESHLGAALYLLNQCLEKEVQKTNLEKKGDWKSLVFVMSNGKASDNWAEPLAATREHVTKLIACQAGRESSESVLPSLTDTVVALRDIAPGTLSAFLRWVSCSVSLTTVPARISGTERGVQEGKRPSRPPPDSTPQHATRPGYLDVVKCLIESGADIETRDSFENTALHMAVSRGNMSLVEILLEKDADLDAVNSEGDTPLLLAINLGFTSIALALIERGANSNLPDRLGRSPLQVAMERCEALPNRSGGRSEKTERTGLPPLPPPPPPITIVL